MSKIYDARMAIVTARKTFEEVKEREWDELSARLRIALEDAVFAAKDAGQSIAAIARDYGTTDRGTIYRILARRADTAEPSAANVTRNGDIYSITVGNETVQFSWDEEFHYAWMFHGTFNPDSALVEELRKENNAYTAQIEAI